MCAAANVACPQRLTCIVIGQYNVTNGINSMFNIAAKNEFILVISKSLRYKPNKHKKKSLKHVVIYTLAHQFNRYIMQKKKN
jgi:hypothetical protein